MERSFLGKIIHVEAEDVARLSVFDLDRDARA